MTINRNTAGEATRIPSPCVQPGLNVASLPLTAARVKSLSSTVLWRVAFCNRIFRFKNPLAVTVNEHSGGWTCESPDLNLIGYGGDEDQARHEFETEFGLAWDGIASEQDDLLTLDAQELKRKMLNLVESVRDCS